MRDKIFEVFLAIGMAILYAVLYAGFAFISLEWIFPFMIDHTFWFVALAATGGGLIGSLEVIKLL